MDRTPPAPFPPEHGPGWPSFYRAAAVAAFAQLGIIFTFFLTGFPPDTAAEVFALYQDQPLTRLTHNEFGTLALIALYLVTAIAVWGALRRAHGPWAAVATAGILVAVGATFAVHSGHSLIGLAERHAAATSTEERAALIAAGEAVIAGDLWHSTAGFTCGILLQGGSVLIGVLMLRSSPFSRWTAWLCILANAMDLCQHLLHAVAPGVASVIQMTMGVFYIPFFPLLGRDLWRLARSAAAPESTFDEMNVSSPAYAEPWRATR